MSVRFDAATDGYTATGPTGTVATVLCWGYISTDRNDYSDIWNMDNGTVGIPEAAMGTDADGTTIVMYDSAYASFGNTALTVGTWYRFAGVMNGTAWTFHRGAAGAAITTTTATRVSISSPTTLRLSLVSAGFWNGRIANVKLYTAALTVDECEAELAQFAPVRTADLRQWHPLLTTDTSDYSGGAVNLTAAGTLAREDDPSIPFGSSPRPVIAGRSSGTTASGTSHSIATMPTGIVAGDRLIVIFSVDGNPTVSEGSGTWTALGQASNSTIVTGAIFHRVATGGDTCTLTTSATEEGSYVVLCIRGPNSAVFGASADGSSTNSNPPSLATGTARNYLWIATRSGDAAVVATAAPASYGNLTSQAGAAGGASTNTAERVLNAATEDPGTFTSNTEQWVSWTLAVGAVDAAPFDVRRQRTRPILIR